MIDGINEQEVGMQDNEVVDDAERDDVVPEVPYDVTSYGSDPDVEGLVRRLHRKEILIPPFQRDYVWRQPEASRFVESLLLGLPVPGVFFSTDPESNKLLVIDGQQRLKSLQFFYDGYFNPKPEDKKRRVFNLVKVQPRLEGKTYETLDERDRIRLDNSIIHATIVKQTAPPGDDTSVYHIFERLNSGGRRLAAQEIRVALYHGRLMEELRRLNEHETWRLIFGKTHPRLKDEELILRFLALYREADRYRRPMAEFLNKFAGRNRNPVTKTLEQMATEFYTTTDIFWKSLGREAFRPTRAINVAVFDSCMVGMAHRISHGRTPKVNSVKRAYEELMRNDEYVEATSRSTADESFVLRRVDHATKAFGKI